MTPDFKMLLAIIIGSIALMGAGCVAIIKCEALYKHEQQAGTMHIDQTVTPKVADKISGATGVQK